MNVDLLSTAASGMEAQRAALDVEARNVAAAEAAGPDGAYRREEPIFTVVQDDAGARVEMRATHTQNGSQGGMLAEMIAVMNASRAYESDASLFDVGKTLDEKTIDLGRSS